MQNATPAVSTAVAAAAVAVAAADATVVKAPKGPSLKSRADAIFAAAMADRKAGKFATNKDFRAAVLSQVQAELGVSVASAATMYNAAKKEAEAADATVNLGRDPKKEKAPSTGKRGRPAGSKNKEKAAQPAADALTLTIEVNAAPVAEGELVLGSTDDVVGAADAAPAEAAA